MAKNIWIINQYAMAPSLGFGGRSFYIGRNLASQGHKVTIIAGSASHLFRKPPVAPDSFNRQSIDGMDFLWVKLPAYANARSSGRVLNWFRFALALTKIHLHLGARPDVIICSSPSLVSWLGAEWQIRRQKAKSVFEVRDIWPLTLIELGGFSRLNPFIVLLQWIERRAYRKADLVVSNLRHADDHMVGVGMDRHKFMWLPNGVDMQRFASPALLPEKADMGLPDDKFIVGYAGTLGEANALDTLVDAAERLRAHQHVHFAIVGDGRMKEELVERAKLANLNNISFIAPVSQADIPVVLRHFDACYIGARRSKLYKFGVGMNKIPEYLMSARPIIYAIDSGQYRPVNEANCGIEVGPENVDALSKAIIALYSMNQSERKIMGERGKIYALNHFDYNIIAGLFINRIFNSQ